MIIEELVDAEPARMSQELFPEVAGAGFISLLAFWVGGAGSPPMGPLILPVAVVNDNVGPSALLNDTVGPTALLTDLSP